MRKGIILVVEDDETLREVYSSYLELEEYIVLQASNGIEALEILLNLQQSTFPDCILLDLIMPVMDGKTLLNVFHNNYSSTFAKIPVIVCSVYSYDQVPQVVGHLSKPIRLNELKNVIQSILNSRKYGPAAS